MSTVVFALIIVGSLVLALAARSRARAGVGDYVVGGRSFGGLLLIVLAVGEIYSVGTLIAFPGGIYAEGAGYGIWFLGYTLLAFPLGYYVGPLIWRAGQIHDALTWPDVIRSHFGNRTLELLVALASLGFLVPWAQYQFSGLQVVLNALDFQYPQYVTVAFAIVMAMAYVLVSGIRSSAMVSILKDLVLLLAIASVGVLALVHFGSPATLFDAALAKGATTTVSGSSLVYAVSTILVQAPTFYLGVLGFSLVATARSETTVKKTFILQPLYMVMHPLLVFASYYALSELYLSDPNQAFTAAAADLGPGVVVGLVAGAAALSGFLLLSVLSLGFGAILSRNVVPGIAPERQRRWVAFSIAAFLVVSATLAVTVQGLMLNILVFAYLISAQAVPAALAVLFGRTIQPAALSAGLVTGLVVAITLTAFGAGMGGLNLGLVGLVVNGLVTVVVSRVIGSRRDEHPVLVPVIDRDARARAPEPA